MLDGFSIEVIVFYLEATPLLAVLLVLLALLLLGTLLRKLLKFALLFVIALLVGLYYTHREASADWRAQAEVVKQQATKLGKVALEKGAELIQDGKKELEKQLGETR